MKPNNYQILERTVGEHQSIKGKAVMTIVKPEKFRLHWLCSQTGRTQPAGVAFFNDDQADYRLKIDALPDDKMIFLKAESANNDTINYRVETVLRRLGNTTYRSTVGSGYSNSESGFPIFIDLGPYSKVLVLEQAA